MPKAGITVESCIVGAWNKKVGDPVALGEILFSYETDKASFECESTAEGTLLDILCGEGDEVPVLAPVCVVGAQGEAIYTAATPAAEGGPAPGAAAEDAAIAKAAADPAVMIDADAGPAAIADADAEARVSPRARRLARRLAIDYRGAAPTGPYGRVVERDIERLAAARAGGTPAEAGSRASMEVSGAIVPPNAEAQPVSPVSGASGRDIPAYTDAKLPPIRRAIAAAMMKSLSEIAQLTHHHSFDASKLLELREEFKRGGSRYGLDGVTVGDVILFAVSRVLHEFPDFNAHLINGDTIRRFSGVGLGVAMATERGLLVPTVAGADKKSLREISSEVKELAKDARKGAISPDKLRGGTFTVSNLGVYGVEMFTPVINPPQVAILGVCGVTTRARAYPGGGIGTYQSMGLSLTYDHRANDGAPAAAFAKRLCEALENIHLLLLGENV